METLTADQFKKKYGDEAAAAFGGSVSGPEAPLAQRVKEAAAARTAAAGRAVAGEGEFGGQSPIRRGTEAAAEVAGIVPDTIVEALPGGAREALEGAGEIAGKGMKSLTDAIASIPGLSEIIIKHPKVAKAIEEAAGTGSALGEIAGDILGAEGGGAAGRAAGRAVKEGAEAIADLSPSKALNSMLTDDGIKKARLAITDLDPQAETILKQTTLPEFEKYHEAAVKAAADPRQPSPLELAGKRAQEALDQVQRKLSNLGSEKRVVIGKAANGLKPVGNIAVKFRQELGKAIDGGVAVQGDATLMNRLLEGAQRLGPNPSAEQVDHFIDSAQELIYTAGRDLTVPVTTAGTARVRALVGQLNDALKAQLPQSYRTLNTKYHDLIGTRDELNTKLGKEGERGGALMKRVFSPSDANTKALFETIKKITGIDLVKEATLARFTMETAGDVRQKSLLKQLDIATRDLGGLDFNKPGTWLRVLQKYASLDAPEAARETIRRSTAQQ
jgi:hypothetical protein